MVSLRLSLEDVRDQCGEKWWGCDLPGWDANGYELRSRPGLGGLIMEKSTECEGEGGIVMVKSCCTESGEPSMMSRSSSGRRMPDGYCVLWVEWVKEENVLISGCWQGRKQKQETNLNERLGFFNSSNGSITPRRPTRPFTRVRIHNPTGMEDPR
jgi:hypothetical protein